MSDRKPFALNAVVIRTYNCINAIEAKRGVIYVIPQHFGEAFNVSSRITPARPQYGQE